MDFTQVDNFIVNDFPKLGIPGGDINVWYRHKQVYRRAFGWFDAENEIPMKEDAIYFLYSLSKPITCTAALILYEQEKFSLSDPVELYLPEFSEVMVKEKDKDGNIQIRTPKTKMNIFNLFNMSAGLNYELSTKYINDTVANNPNASTRDIVKAISKTPLEYNPGEGWLYSLGHDVLAALVEKISGIKFRDFVKKYIFEPLEMHDTSFEIPNKNPRFAKQYIHDYNKHTYHLIDQANEFAFTPNYDSGGAGIISTNDDYMKFACALSNFGVGENKAQILTKKTINLMRSDALTNRNRQDFNWEVLRGYGYGLGVRTHINKEDSNSLSSIGEFGWSGLAGSYTAIDPDNNLAIVYTQHMINNLEEIVHPKIRNLIYSSIFCS